MRKNWKSPPVRSVGNGIEKSLKNNVDYSSYVNDGHRIVNRSGETVGYWNGYHMLESANNVVEKAMVREFNTEIERVNKAHDK